MIDFHSQVKENDEVIFSNESRVNLTKLDILKLIDLAKDNKRERIRFCSHSSSDDIIHEMFIVQPKEAYIKPHKHINKIESMLVLHGEVDCVLFDEDANITNKIEMGNFESGKTFYNSIKTEQCHSLLIKSDWLVFLEITKGPFNRDDTVYTNWSPEENDLIAVNNFIKKLKE